MITISLTRTGLNPCSNGRCSARTTRSSPSTALKSLNPCSNGRCSASEGSLTLELDDHGVLILVLMEDALRAAILWKSYQKGYVLILVLMEDALQVRTQGSGCLSSTTVLILVLMEDALRGRMDLPSSQQEGVLIPVLMEDALRVMCRRTTRTIAS